MKIILTMINLFTIISIFNLFCNISFYNFEYKSDELSRYELMVKTLEKFNPEIKGYKNTK